MLTVNFSLRATLRSAVVLLVTVGTGLGLAGVAEAKARPDLAVRSASAALADGRLSLRVEIANHGSARAKPFSVSLAFRNPDDGRSLRASARRATTAIRGHRTRQMRVGISWPAIRKLPVVVVCADADHQIREVREGNNCRSITVRSSAADQQPSTVAATSVDGVVAAGVPPRPVAAAPTAPAPAPLPSESPLSLEHGQHTLDSGQGLGPNEQIISPDAHYRLTMSPDGDLVEEVGKRVLWSTGTAGHPGAYALVTADGNLVVVSHNGTRLWDTAVGRHPGARIVLGSNADVTLSSEGVRHWHANVINDTLQTNETLVSSQILESSARRYWLAMQEDGNLVEYYGSRALWASNTGGNSGAWVAMQQDGNLVIYSASGSPLWASDTGGTAGRSLSIQIDVNLVIYAPGGQATWASWATNHTLAIDETLKPNELLLSSDRRFTFVMQGDGNLVLYREGVARWASNTAGNPGAYAAMQGDGNFVVYTPEGSPIWDSHTGGGPGTRVEVQSDGDVVMYTPGGAAVWSTGTAPGPGPFQPAIGDDYPYAGASPLNVDPWNFYFRECVSFVAWRMNRDVGRTSAPWWFTNGMGGGHWGNAHEWDNNAGALGYAVNGTPAVGSVAQWNAGEGGAGGAGHVAYVVGVNGDGSVTVEEYNFRVAPNDHRYGVRYNVHAPRYLHIVH
jgi:surface antigen